MPGDAGAERALCMACCGSGLLRSPSSMLDIIDRIEKGLWDRFKEKKYQNVKRYLSRWHEKGYSGFNDSEYYENFSIITQKDSDNISVSKLLNEYTAKLDGIWLRIKDKIKDQRLEDYKLCKLAVKRSREHTYYGLLFGTAVKNKVCALDHLNKYFTAKEIDTIISKQTPEKMADAAIAIKDKLGICDDNMKKLIYQLFINPSKIPLQAKSG